MRSKWEEEWRDRRMETGEVSCAALWMTVTIIQFSVMGAQTGPRANQITASRSGDRTSRSLWPYLYAQSVCSQGNRICGQQMPCQTPPYLQVISDGQMMSQGNTLFLSLVEFFCLFCLNKWMKLSMQPEFELWCLCSCIYSLAMAAATGFISIMFPLGLWQLWHALLLFWAYIPMWSKKRHNEWDFS